MKSLFVSSTVLYRFMYRLFSSDFKLSWSNNSTSLLWYCVSSIFEGQFSIFLWRIVIFLFYSATCFLCSSSLAYSCSYSASICWRYWAASVFCISSFFFLIRSSSWSNLCFSSLKSFLSYYLSSLRVAFSSINACTAMTSCSLTDDFSICKSI